MGFFMRPVAEWFAGACLAAAPGHLLFFGNFHKHRPHACGAVGSVAKRLFFGLAAAAPDITARFDLHDKRMVVFAHQFKCTGLDVTDTESVGLSSRFVRRIHIG